MTGWRIRGRLHWFDAVIAFVAAAIVVTFEPAIGWWSWPLGFGFGVLLMALLELAGGRA